MSKDERKSSALDSSSDRWDWLDAIAGTLDEDFLDAALEQPPYVERPELDRLFSQVARPLFRHIHHESPDFLPTAGPPSVLMLV
jgi:hypothetical protein